MATDPVRQKRKPRKPKAGISTARAEELLRYVAAGVSARVGEDYFRSLAQYLTQALHLDFAFVGELTADGKAIETLSLCVQGKIAPNRRYVLTQTPCQSVIEERKPAACVRGLRRLFPNAPQAVELGIESYLGVPLVTASGAVVGLLAVMDSRPLSNRRTAEWMLQIFAARAAAELERKRAETALHESQRSLATLMSNLPGMVYRCRNDERWTMEFVSEGVLELTGLLAADLTGEGSVFLAALIHPDDRQRVWDSVQAAVRARRPYELTYRMVVASGQLKWVWEQGRGIFTPEGELLCLEGFITDVTEQRQTEEALRKNEQLLRTILDTLPVGAWVTDKDGNILSANPAGQRIWSGSDGAAVARAPFGSRAGAGRGKGAAPHQQALARALAHGQSSYDEECSIECPDGTRKMILNSAVPIRGPDDEIIGALVVNQDITARKQAEEALRRSEARLASAQRLAHIGHWDWDLEADELAWSDEIYRIFGLKPHEFAASYEAFLARVHPEDRAAVDGGVKAALRGERAYRLEHRIVRPDGGVRYVYQQAEVTLNPAKKPSRMFGTVQDVTERRQAEEALRQGEERFRTVAESIPDGLMILDEQGAIEYLNQSAARLFGYALQDVVGTNVDRLMSDLEADEEEPLSRRLRPGARPEWPGELIGRHRTGHTFAVDAALNEMRLGERRAFVAIVRDITARKADEAEMRKLSSAVQQTADSVIITDRDGVIEYVNEAFVGTTGFSREEAIGKTPSIVKSGMHEPEFYRHLWEVILAGETFRDIFINRKKGGELYYEEKAVTPLKDEKGRVTHFISTGKDITERMQTQERLQFLAHHDPLTTLPNRILFMDRLHQALIRAPWHQRVVTVMFLDLDRFKNINDTLGHNIGDRFLQQMAQRLGESVREGDTVARLGGDEFAILLEDVRNVEDISMVARKILRAFELPFSLEGRELYITASIGISLYPSDGVDAAALLKNADAAMYRAKDVGRNNFQFYSADMSVLAFERLTLESSLRRALDRQEFRVHYQPQVDFMSGAIVGMEALVRWEHPDLGLMLPGQFLAVAEETGIIVAIDEWVARTACAQARAWRDAGLGPIRMAVNLSGRQFDQPGFMESVARLLLDAGLDPSLLELEITEGVIMKDARLTIERLHALRALGVGLAIDDFGTGYSSLSYLRRFPINSLKIDKSFVHDVTHDPDDAQIVRTIIAMAHSLKLTVIAEGVETPEQAAFLRDNGCDALQGYLFSRAAPAGEITRMLRAGRRLQL